MTPTQIPDELEGEVCIVHGGVVHVYKEPPAHCAPWAAASEGLIKSPEDAPEVDLIDGLWALDILKVHHSMNVKKCNQHDFGHKQSSPWFLKPGLLFAQPFHALLFEGGVIDIHPGFVHRDNMMEYSGCVCPQPGQDITYTFAALYLVRLQKKRHELCTFLDKFQVKLQDSVNGSFRNTGLKTQPGNGNPSVLCPTVLHSPDVGSGAPCLGSGSSWFIDNPCSSTLELSDPVVDGGIAENLVGVHSCQGGF